MIAALPLLLLLAPGGELPDVDEPVVDESAPVPPPPPPSAGSNSPEADMVQPAGEDPDTRVEKHERLDIQTGSTTVVEESVGPTEYRQSYVKPPPSPEAIQRQSTFETSARKSSRLYRPPGSPQRFGVELKFGPYLPDVDRDYTGDDLGPYATVFGRTNDLGEATKQPKPGLFSALSFEWQFFYLYGPLSIGLQAGFFRDKARAIIADPGPGESIRSEADDTTFSVLPLSALVGYRFAFLADRFRVPLIPYFRGGLAYGFWWSKDGSGKIAKNDAGKASGGVIGWQINPGLMLRLDWIEPGNMKRADQTSGVNHISVFGEYQLSRIDNFGRGSALSLGDSTFLVGLNVEF